MHPMFSNRDEAASLLVDQLQSYRGQHPLILAIPRGAVPMGTVIAARLQGELDIVLVRKIGAPGNAEYAIGAVDETGAVLLNPGADRLVDEAYLAQEVRQQVQTMRRRRALYTPVRPPIDPHGRIVIVVDDGIATGATMMAALRLLRAKKPRELVVAIGVAPAEAIARLQRVADRVVCLHSAQSFSAVGQFYADFRQVEDEEVMALLREDVLYSTAGQQ